VFSPRLSDVVQAVFNLVAGPLFPLPDVSQLARTRMAMSV